MARSLALFIFLFWSCSTTEDTQLFTSIPSEKSGLYFENRVTENDKYNVYDYHNIYNGGGIGVLDVNNDGLKDLFITGNQVKDKLYLNKGNLQFEDISNYSGIISRGWSTGVSIVDINEDGFDDIYICKAGNEPDSLLANQLFLNNGDNTFTEDASARGIDDTSLSTQAAFFDFDKDGDLDLYLLTTTNKYRNPNVLRKPSTYAKDILYLNVGKGYFEKREDIGISSTTHGLGLALGDLNNDGYEDILASSDFLPNDALYINNKGDSFTNTSTTSLPFLGRFSMGNDIADINEDGHLDIITTDMLPEENSQQKKMLMTSYQVFEAELELGYQAQFTRNMLFVNDALPSKIPTFSELGQFYGINATDWSWAPLIVDWDNDGHKDISITNGYVRDVTDSDYISYRQSLINQNQKKEEERDFIKNNAANLPQLLKKNKLFRNTGDGFEDVSETWVTAQPSFSNGSVFCDLDNDGDHELVVNNINQRLFLYKNNSNNNFIKVSLKGPKSNIHGQGARLTLSLSDGTEKHYYQSLTRGYLSSVDPAVIFGIGKEKEIEKLSITWPNGFTQKILNPKINSTLELNIADASHQVKQVKPAVSTFVKSTLDFKHEDERFIDFNSENLLLQKYSNIGPVLVKGDLNRDGLEDIIALGEKDNYKNFQQEKGGNFKHLQLGLIISGEIGGAKLTDVNGDGFLDLYVLKSSNEFNEGSDYQDQLFLGNENGSFLKETEIQLPQFLLPGGFIETFDADQDGDIDFLRGGYAFPSLFPKSTATYLLINDGKGHFTSKNLGNLGIFTDAIAADINKNGFKDIIAVGHFTPPVIFFNERGNITAKTLPQELSGLWNCIENINENSFVLGNIGKNYRYKFDKENPLMLYEFKGKTKTHYIPTYVYKNKRQPVTARDELIRQIPELRALFPNYASYAENEQLNWLKATKIGVSEMSSGILTWNTSEKSFSFEPLPNEAQRSSTQTSILVDANNDGIKDLFLYGKNIDLDPSHSGHIAGHKGQVWDISMEPFKLIKPDLTGLIMRENISQLMNVNKTIVGASYNDSLVVFKP